VFLCVICLGFIYGSPAPKYKIGDFAQGGIVFWVDKTGEHGLVCAKSDSPFKIMWSTTHSKISSYKEDIYDGKENTELIRLDYNETIASFKKHFKDYKPSPNSCAAIYCDTLSISQDGVTYDDWYLPSIKELSQVYDNYVLIDKIASENGGDVFKKRPYFQITSYWSSTEYKNSDYAYRVRFSNGRKLGLDKNYAYRVRAIRAF
jgi:hypothetical protein